MLSARRSAGSLGLNGSLTLVVEQVIEGGKDTPVGAGQYVLRRI